MFRNQYLLPLGVVVLAMLPALRDAVGGAGVQWQPLSDEVTFQCNQTNPKMGESVYVVGSHPALGNWRPAEAVKLNRNPDSTWTGKVLFPGADDGKDVEWKCIERNDAVPTNAPNWQPDPNNKVKLTFKTSSVGSF
ncbi:carbohydrate-binding module family 20 domain-containing protein [Pseudomonas sp. NPDC086278]|uniref:carbohydrate-binding module family 20 domain-containing protein n=1 Tax=Pseudomonas sp. NPDC086278 TaxID=3390646 RepID=UPI003D0559DE